MHRVYIYLNANALAKNVKHCPQTKPSFATIQQNLTGHTSNNKTTPINC